MAKAASTPHAKAQAAYLLGQISRDDYQLCCKGKAWVSGRYVRYAAPFDFPWKLGRPRMKPFMQVRHG